MKILRILVLLYLYSQCKGSLVIKISNNQVKNNEKTYLTLKKTIKISFPLTFCTRFNLKGQLLTSRPIFSDENNEFGFTLRFGVGLGRVILSDEILMFKIPKENDIQPYAWHHICVKSDENSQEVVFDGKIWYTDQHKKYSKEVTLNKFLVGANYPNGNNYADTAYFRGEISEFNIWSEALGTEKLKKITSHCGKPLPEPDILNWSEIDTSMLTGNNVQNDIRRLCRNSNETPTIYKVMPHFQNQEEAIHTCQILNGQLAYPKSIKEYQEWQGKDYIMIKFQSIIIN